MNRGTCDERDSDAVQRRGEKTTLHMEKHAMCILKSKVRSRPSLEHVQHVSRVDHREGRKFFDFLTALKVHAHACNNHYQYSSTASIASRSRGEVKGRGMDVALTCLRSRRVVCCTMESLHLW